MERWLLYLWYHSSGGIRMVAFGQCSFWYDNSMFNWYITLSRSVLTCGLWRIRSGNGTIIFGVWLGFGNLVLGAVRDCESHVRLVGWRRIAEYLGVLKTCNLPVGVFCVYQVCVAIIEFYYCFRCNGMIGDVMVVCLMLSSVLTTALFWSYDQPWLLIGCIRPFCWHTARGRAWVSRYVDLNDAHVLMIRLMVI